MSGTNKFQLETDGVTVPRRRLIKHRLLSCDLAERPMIDPNVLAVFIVIRD